jgi:Fe-S cluster assembly protein SufD
MVLSALTTDSRLGGFSVPDADLPGHDLDWLREMRETARQFFAETGLPTGRDEAWKYSDPKAIGATSYETGAVIPDDLDADPDLGLADAHRVVLVNGRRSEERSSRHTLPEGVLISGLADALRDCPELVRQHLGSLIGCEDGGFAALNAALFSDGAFILVPEGVRLDRPVLVLSRTTTGDRPSAAHVRNLVVVGARSSIRFVTAHVSFGDGAPFTNAITEVITGDDAEFDHVQIELGCPGSHLFDQHVLEVGSSTRARTRHVSLGRGWARSDLYALLSGEGADLRMAGANLATDRRHVDFHTTIDHAMPHGQSHELFKTIADEGSTGVFTGRIIVRQDAQKTDARQMSRNLLLTEGATIWTRPQLEIHADDVKCAHGATTGRLDDEALFYLRTRGIDLATARRILMSAFMTDIIDDIPVDGLRDNLRLRMEHRLSEIVEDRP